MWTLRCASSNLTLLPVCFIFISVFSLSFKNVFHTNRIICKKKSIISAQDVLLVCTHNEALPPNVGSTVNGEIKHTNQIDMQLLHLLKTPFTSSDCRIWTHLYNVHFLGHPQIQAPVFVSVNVSRTAYMLHSCPIWSAGHLKPVCQTAKHPQTTVCC